MNEHDFEYSVSIRAEWIIVGGNGTCKAGTFRWFFYIL